MSENRSIARPLSGTLTLPAWQIITGDCLAELPRLSEQPRLIFADPPYNIGIDYGDGVGADRLPDAEYLAWARRWVHACRDTLAPDGSLWVLISDEYAAGYGVLLEEAGLVRRNWVKWYESFGVCCTGKFGRCSRHLFYCVKDPACFVFHANAVRVKSARQTVYNDARANPEGKVMDDVWSDIPRLAGTHRERIKGFPTQLPLALLSRVVACASNPGDLVLDPFSGSGTTGVAALQLGRRYLGIEKQPHFADLARQRLLAVESAAREPKP
jgi:site-specific DNA-methyltransferase (adenine-specific)